MNSIETDDGPQRQDTAGNDGDGEIGGCGCRIGDEPLLEIVELGYGASLDDVDSGSVVAAVADNSTDDADTLGYKVGADTADCGDQRLWNWSVVAGEGWLSKTTNRPQKRRLLWWR